MHVHGHTFHYAPKPNQTLEYMFTTNTNDSLSAPWLLSTLDYVSFPPDSPSRTMQAIPCHAPCFCHLQPTNNSLHLALPQHPTKTGTPKSVAAIATTVASKYHHLPCLHNHQKPYHQQRHNAMHVFVLCHHGSIAPCKPTSPNSPHCTSASQRPPCSCPAPPHKPCLTHASLLHPIAGKVICGHLAHILCALQCLLAGKVKEVIMLDALSTL